MRRLPRVLILLVVALALVPSLPLYIERTMTRSWMVNGGGESIEWGWRLCTLKSYWSNHITFRHEQHCPLWLAVNLALALTYALLIALGIDQILLRLKRRKTRIK
jgi:hypothetical protein